jgi:hypothetical protein
MNLIRIRWPLPARNALLRRVLGAVMLIAMCGNSRAQPGEEPATPFSLPSSPAAPAPSSPGPAAAADGAAAAPRDLSAEGRRNAWRNLSPADRAAIRNLLQEQRNALGKRPSAHSGRASPPGARLSPEERKRLNEQIREDRERRGGRFGGRRP